jgi:RNA polymerase sigma-70 factor (ECF subfamily)
MLDSRENDGFTTQLIAVQRRMYAYIVTIAPNLQDADDILQKTNAVLLQSRESFAPGTEFGAWACRVAYFQVLAHRKQQQRERGHLLFADEELLQNLAGEASEEWADRESRMLAKLERCMSEVSDSHRELLKLRYSENLSSKHIAATTDRSAPAVRRALYRIRMQLLECLQRDTKEDRL